MGYYLDSELVSKLKIPTKRLVTPITVHNVNGTQNIAGRIEKSAEIEFEVCGRRRRALFYVTTLGKQAIILGLP